MGIDVHTGKMDKSLAVLIPAKRAHRVAPVVAAWAANTPPLFNLYFICDSYDLELIEAVEQYPVELIIHNGGFAKKLNYGVRVTKEPLLFFGADDLEPMPGWFPAATALLNEEIQVVGINDMIPRHRDLQTHWLLTREYANLPCIDGDPGPLYEGYKHWCVDDEFLGTARKRQLYAYAHEARFNHLHPLVGKAEDDEHYRYGQTYSGQDMQLRERRGVLWT